MYLLKPCSGSPSVSFRASLLIFSRYSPLATAVVISFAVYAIGRPICSVSSVASTSCLSLMSFRALLTIACRSPKGKSRKSLKACVEIAGRRATSESDRLLLVNMGSFVVGDMVVRTSVGILEAASYEEAFLRNMQSPAPRQSFLVAPHYANLR